MADLSQHASVREAKRRADPEIAWRFVPRIEPGIYRAYCRSATVYRDGHFKRWLCAAQFDVLSEDLDSTLARLTMFLNLGSKEKPDVSRRRRYWSLWIQANGGRPPVRGDRLSPRIFTKRMAIVEVSDTTKNVRQEPVTVTNCYSVVRNVIEWQTGSPNMTPQSESRQKVQLGPSRGQGSSTQLKPKGGPPSGGPSKAHSGRGSTQRA
jgi:hypothetical protein